MKRRLRLMKRSCADGVFGQQVFNAPENRTRRYLLCCRRRRSDIVRQHDVVRTGPRTCGVPWRSVSSRIPPGRRKRGVGCPDGRPATVTRHSEIRRAQAKDTVFIHPSGRQDARTEVAANEDAGWVFFSFFFFNDLTTKRRDVDDGGRLRCGRDVPSAKTTAF